LKECEEGRVLKEGNGRIKGGEMKEGHHCARLRGFDGGGAMDPAGNGRRLEGGAAIPRLEVEGAPDRGAPPVSLWRKKKREEALQDRRGRQAGPARAVCARTGKRPLALVVCGLKEVLGRLERKEGRGRRFSLFLFKFFSNSFFQTFKLQTNRNPCIRDMMHKHLLLLDYFSDV
jgi:hypothetical protein